jgi:hypothetical protein
LEMGEDGEGGEEAYEDDERAPALTILSCLLSGYARPQNQHAEGKKGRNIVVVWIPPLA